MQRVRGESRFNGGDSLLLSPEGGRCGLTSSVALRVQRGMWGTPMVLGAFVGTAPWDEEKFRDPFG